MTTLIIARHGNTFESHEEPRRIGMRTDLPLTKKGEDQARALGSYLKAQNLVPDTVFTSTLRRTQETARLALKAAEIKRPLYPLKIFDEIDYGCDENQPESHVISRIGQKAIDDWDTNNIPPSDWNVNITEIMQNWRGFMDEYCNSQDIITQKDINLHETVLVITSNGIAKFAPQIAANHTQFFHNAKTKLSTGAIGIITFDKKDWHIKAWNLIPPSQTDC